MRVPKIKFIFLTQYYPPEIGATQTRIASVVRVLRDLGHEVQVVTAMPHHLAGKTFPKYRRKYLVRETIDGVSIIRTWIYAASGLGMLRLLNYLSFALTSVAGLLLCRRADVIFIDSPPMFLSVPGVLIGRLRKMKVIFNVADLWPDSVRQLGAFGNSAMFAVAESLERWTYQQSDLVCAVSRGIAATLSGEKHVPARKVVYFPNGVDTQMFAPRPANRELQLRFGGIDAHVILYAGTHGAAQGLENLIEAATLLRETTAHFVFVGEGHTKPALKAMVQERGLANVHFVDSVPLTTVPDYYSIATASIVPLIEREAFKSARPQKMFPSLASGVPIIFSGEGEAAALIADNEAGIVVPPESGEEIAKACRRLMQDHELRDRLGKNGRSLACRTFEWKAIVNEWLETANAALISES